MTTVMLNKETELYMNKAIAMLNKEAELYMNKAHRITEFTSLLTQYITDKKIVNNETINCAIAWFNTNPQMSPIECLNRAIQ